MRRLTAGFLAFLAVTGTLLTLPVYAAPAAGAHPVAPSIDEVTLGSVVDPVGDAVVTTDGEVQPGGVDESEATAPQSTAPQSTAPQTTAPAEDLPNSGEELAGVPALTVSREDTDEFSSVGVTWRDDPSVTDVVVQLRVRSADGSWGEWTSIEPDDVEQTDSAETRDNDVRAGTAPYWTGEAQGVEVIVQGAGGAVPEDVKVALIDPGQSSADGLAGAAQPTATAHAATTMPRIFTRAEWGADESIRTWAPEYVSTLKAATVHHTADSNDYTADQVPAILRSMYAYHTKTRGWGDIGYNVVVDKFGRAFEGRYGGLTSTVVGAHAGGFNSYTFGVSMLGNYDVVAVPQATIDTVSQVIAWKLSLYGVDPRGSTVLTSGGGGTSKYAAGAKVTLPTVFAHRDVGATACPGRYGFDQMNEIRDRVAALTGDQLRAIERTYMTNAGLRASLGAPVGSEQPGNGYAWQEYQRGRLYWSAAAGVHMVWGAILDRYLAAGGPAALGVPTTDEGRSPDGVGSFTHFAKSASIYWAPSTGAQVVWGGMRSTWAASGWEQGYLGYPLGAEVYAAGGSAQEFQRGTLAFSSASGVHSLIGAVRDRWLAVGGVESGWLPTTDEQRTPDGKGSFNHFSNGGSIYWSAETGAQPVWGGIRETWSSTGWERGALGYPIGGESAVPGGAQQKFQRGVVVWSASGGAHPITGDVLTGWTVRGGAAAGLFPVADQVASTTGKGAYQVFSGGVALAAAPSGRAQAVVGGNLAAWLALGAIDGALGLPTGEEQYSSRGSVQEFQSATMAWSTAGGSHELQGAIRDAWRAAGGLSAGLLPSSNEIPTVGGSYNTFTNGQAIYWSPGGGAHLLWGAILERWRALGASAGGLGFPTTGEYALAGGRGAGVTFQRGVVYWSALTGAHEVFGGINETYQRAGGASSPLGLPASDEYDIPGGRRSDFQHGLITYDGATGAIHVTVG